MQKAFAFFLKTLASALPIAGIASAGMASYGAPENNGQIDATESIAALTRVIVDDPTSPAADAARRALSELANPTTKDLGSLSNDRAAPGLQLRLSGEPSCEPYCTT